MDANNKIRVFCAVPTTGTIADAQSYFWREAEKKYADRIEFIWPALCVRRIFHDFARNSLVEEFLKSDADILYFLDSDVVPPPDVFDMVMEHEKWVVAGAPYPIFMTPPGYTEPQIVFTAYKGVGSKGVSAADCPNEGKEFIDGLATGCLFVKRELFSQMQKPYFAFEYDEETRSLTAGEDLSFCRKVRDLGHKFYVDYSKVCRHYKHVCLLEMNNYARQYAKSSVSMYDSLVRPLLSELQAKLKAKSKPPAIVAPSGRDIDKLINKFRT
jgi:hypothetical protein